MSRSYFSAEAKKEDMTGTPVEPGGLKLGEVPPEPGGVLGEPHFGCLTN